MNGYRFPANQLCTDDFTGRLGNNTNLAAKGIIALEAFAYFCNIVGERGCEKYSAAAKSFVPTWMSAAFERDPAPHYKIAYNFSNSYSIKCKLHSPAPLTPLDSIQCLHH